MKIDLHIHTKKIADGDPKTRNISANEFKKKMENADIGIAAITNHHYFDEKQYKEFESKNDYILLPGVELDIDINNQRVQANVISHPNDIEKFKEILKRIKNDKKPIKYKEFVKEFNQKKWIISLDWKNDNRWNEIQMKKAINDFKNAFVISDVNRAATLMILNANNFQALIGSDIANWEDYNEISKELLNTKFKIDSYDKFWSILKLKKIELKDLFSKISIKKFENIEMPDSNPNGSNFLIKELIIKEGVNIIFGEKRTGKSEILKHINEKFKTNSSFYKSSNKDISIKNIEESLKKESTLFSNEKEFWKKLIKKLLDFKEKKFTRFIDFFYSLNNSSDITFHNKIEETILNPLRDHGEKISNHYELSNLIKKTHKLLLKLEIENKNWLEESEKILEKIWNIHKKLFKDYWKLNISKKIKEEIDLLLIKNKGQKSIPTNIGLWDRYNEKVLFLKNLKEMKDFKKNDHKKIVEFKIPKRNKVFASHFISFVNFFEEDKKNWKKFKNQKLKIKGIYGKLKNLNYNEVFNLKISEIVDLFNKFPKKESNLDYFFTDYVKIVDEDENSTFSNGEQAHLLLENCLSNKHKDYYILDEPGVFLSRNSITKFLLPKITELVENGKKIIIATHNSSIGINSVPINYIYRKYESGNSECKTYIGSIWQKNFYNIKNMEEDSIRFLDVIIESFEGSEKHFRFRKEIYESRI